MTFPSYHVGEIRTPRKIKRKLRDTPNLSGEKRCIRFFAIVSGLIAVLIICAALFL
ncbi:MAG: hypothetical protein PHH01_01205 [Patescibacteria group bacterium]|nr:hypothetical protein [Patescibacteria group bacterium]